MDEYRQRFGQQIRNARKATRLSRDTVSEKAEITLKYLGEIERGEKWPSFEVAIKIARVLGVSPSVFLEDIPSATDSKSIRNDIVRLLEHKSAKQLLMIFRVAQAILTSPSS
jgi:transcriptional regulator with XRE-family HTH domain